MSDNVIQVMLSLPPVNINDLEGVETTADLLKVIAREKDSEKWKNQAHLFKQAISMFGGSLELILDEVEDPYERAQALRKLVSDMKGYL